MLWPKTTTKIAIALKMAMSCLVHFYLLLFSAANQDSSKNRHNLPNLQYQYHNKAEACSCNPPMYLFHRHKGRDKQENLRCSFTSIIIFYFQNTQRIKLT